MACICDHAGYCPLLRRTVTVEEFERCQRDPAFLEDRRKAAGVRKMPRRGDEPRPIVAQPPKPKPCKSCGPSTVKTWQPVGPVVTNKDGRPAIGLRDQFHGQSVFLIGGGPSFKSVDQSKLTQRGITLAAMNNVATMIRPHIWFSVDLPRNFAETIWRDPAIMKFTFDKHLKDTRPVDAWNGERWVKAGLAKDCPNVWGMAHKHGWNAETFLTDTVPTWGANGPQEDPEGKHKHCTVMLPSLWMLYWLGFRNVYLLGCDFNNSTGSYAFDENCDPGNISLWGWLSRRFAEVKPHFEQFGFRVVNCTEKSSLDVFERMTLDAAIAEMLSNWPDKIQTKGMYRG